MEEKNTDEWILKIGNLVIICIYFRPICKEAAKLHHHMSTLAQNMDRFGFCDFTL